MEINNLHKVILNFQKPELNREWTRINANTLKFDPRGRMVATTAVFGVSPNTSLSVSFLPGALAKRAPIPPDPCLAALWSGKTAYIRVYSRPFAVAAAFLRNPFSPNEIEIFFCSHAENAIKTAQNTKTYRRLLGMIFLEGSRLL